MKKILLMLACVSMQASAEFYDGNNLLSNLESTNELKRSMGYGYVAGVFDAGQSTVHCSPEKVTLRQVVDMVKKLLLEMPEQRNMSADRFVFLAARQAWPCKKGNGV
jgi:hypothetical protein